MRRIAAAPGDVAPYVPPHWPVVEPGMMMAHVGTTMVCYVDERMSEASFWRQLDEMEIAFRLLAEKVPPGVTRAALWHVVGNMGADAKRRKAVSDVLARHRETLARTTSAYALVSSSTILRGMLQAIFWLAPPPYAWSIEPTPRAGFEFLATKQPGLDPAACDEQYRRLLDRLRAA
jgi:hypothetical protein